MTLVRLTIWVIIVLANVAGLMIGDYVTLSVNVDYKDSTVNNEQYGMPPNLLK